MTETEIVEKARRVVRELNTRYGKKIAMHKLHGGPTQTSGLPDLIFIYLGVTYYVEVKTEKGKTTKLQEYRLSELSKCFAPCFVTHGWDGMHGLKSLLDCIANGHSDHPTRYLGN